MKIRLFYAVGKILGLQENAFSNVRFRYICNVIIDRNVLIYFTLSIHIYY